MFKANRRVNGLGTKTEKIKVGKKTIIMAS